MWKVYKIYLISHYNSYSITGLLGLLTAPIFAIDGMRVDGHFVGGIIYGGHQMAFASFGWNLFAACCIVLWTGKYFYPQRIRPTLNLYSWGQFNPAALLEYNVIMFCVI